jgi:hypothetical protein
VESTPAVPPETQEVEPAFPSLESEDGRLPVVEAYTCDTYTALEMARWVTAVQTVVVTAVDAFDMVYIVRGRGIH